MKEGGILAQGDPNNDFKKLFRVRVFDKIGSWTDQYIETIVLPPLPETLIRMADGKVLKLLNKTMQ